MVDLAIIGGTGLAQLDSLDIIDRDIVHTPYGDPSGPLTKGILYGKKVVFLARHGDDHTIPPHKINYRANMWALKEAGANRIFAVAAVGGIRADLLPGKLVIPDQIIDYTDSRKSSYFEEGLQHLTHIDFTDPYSENLRVEITRAAKAAKVAIINDGVYAATQGPRLETAAEINRLEKDGCDMVGMTGMPEAALARELELSYATCAVIANHAAGRGSGVITMKNIEKQLTLGMQSVAKVLEQLVQLL